MELKNLWKMIRRRWWLILIPPAVVLALTYPALLNPPGGAFTTAMHITAAQPLAGIERTYEDASYFPWLAAEQLIDALTMWARTSTFAEEVRLAAAEQGVALPPRALLGAFAADNSQMVMRLIITWPDADQLEVIARAAVEVLKNRNRDYFPSLADNPAQVIGLDEPVLSPVAPPLLTRYRPVVQIALALAVGLGLAALLEYLDTAVHSREEVEALDLPVLGEIPRHRGLRY